MSTEFKFKRIPLKQIKMEENTRLAIEKLSLHELVASIKQNGVLQPAGVFKKGDYYTLVWGNRRFRASKITRQGYLPCVVAPTGTTEREFLIWNLTENIQRKGVDPYEQGRGFKELRDRHELSSNEIAAQLGISAGTVVRNLSLYEGLPREMIKDLAPFKGRQADKGKISPMVASKIIAVQKNSKISKVNTQRLYNFGKSGQATPERIHQIGSLMNRGIPIATAIKKVKSAQPITFSFAMNRQELDKLVKKHKKKPEDIIKEVLKADKEIKKCLIL